MKQCPTCRTTYTDETLRFCLADGAPLTDLGGEQSTVVRPTSGGLSDEKTVAMGGEQMRADIPQNTASPPPQYQSIRQPSSGSGGVLKVLLVVLGLGIFVVLLAIVGLILFYKPRPDQADKIGPDLKTPASSPAPTKDDKDYLRDLIANLEKQLANQKNDGPSAKPVSTPNLSSTTMTTTARANSPGDGFLALRSLPSASVGDRIIKIPHGASLSVGACGPLQQSVHPGRWCQARYNGYSGYVYDYYLTY